MSIELLLGNSKEAFFKKLAHFVSVLTITLASDVM